MALHINYSEYRDYHFTCPSCDWKGTGKDTCQNASGVVMDLECPGCFIMLAIVESSSYTGYPGTLRKDTEAERQVKLREINFREKFKHMSLKSSEELPEIDDNNICFTFRPITVKGEDYSIIEHREMEIWREPMVWEGYERFMEIGRILKDKYGSRMLDLVPDETAETFLFGDKLDAPTLVVNFRKELRK